MRTNAIRRACLTIALSVVGTALAAAPAAADPHHPLSGEELLESCAGEMNSSLPVDVTLPSGSSSTLVGSYNNSGQSACWNFGWAEFDAPAAAFTVAPEFAGPNINSSAWDCNHSLVTYGIYGQTSSGQWVYLRGGLMYGKLSNGVCGYDVNNFPSQASWGANSWKQWGGGKFRIGTRSWSHDDPQLGHHHDSCDDLANCVWNTLLHITVE